MGTCNSRILSVIGSELQQTLNTKDWRQHGYIRKVEKGGFNEENNLNKLSSVAVDPVVEQKGTMCHWES